VEWLYFLISGSKEILLVFKSLDFLFFQKKSLNRIKNFCKIRKKVGAR